MNQSQVQVALLAAALALAAGPAAAQGVPLDDRQLSGVWGQALLDLTNTTQGNYAFSRLTLNADVTLSASLSGLQLGTKNGVSDINIGTLNFGRSDLGDAARTVAITSPYFEWVYSGTVGSADRQVVGMRLGFGSIAGDVGLTMNTVSGALTINTDANGLMSSTGSQSTTLTGSSCACTLALNQIGGVTAGDGNGASRDFFLSILKSALTWPTTDATVGAATQAQAGFWLNWADKLKAINTTGTVPPNIPKIGP